MTSWYYTPLDGNPLLENSMYPHSESCLFSTWYWSLLKYSCAFGWHSCSGWADFITDALWSIGLLYSLSLYNPRMHFDQLVVFSFLVYQNCVGPNSAILILLKSACAGFLDFLRFWMATWGVSLTMDLFIFSSRSFVPWVMGNTFDSLCFFLMFFFCEGHDSLIVFLFVFVIVYYLFLLEWNWATALNFPPQKKGYSFSF